MCYGEKKEVGEMKGERDHITTHSSKTEDGLIETQIRSTHRIIQVDKLGDRFIQFNPKHCV